MNFNATFKAMKYKICVDNHKYDLENILRIAESTCTKMVENGSWNSPSTILQSVFVVNTSCWNSGGNGHKADACPSKKVTKTTKPNKTKGKLSATRNREPDLKLIDEKPFNTINEQNSG